MKKLIPVMTEKSLTDAKAGVYQFYVDRGTNKHQAKMFIQELFGVKVVRVRSANVAGTIRKNYLGRKKIIPSRKKIFVSLLKGQKIDLFETKKEGKK